MEKSGWGAGSQQHPTTESKKAVQGSDSDAIVREGSQRLLDTLRSCGREWGKRDSGRLSSLRLERKKGLASTGGASIRPFA